MFIHSKEQGKPTEAPGLKEIKVRIPLDFHWRLHTLRLINGTHISDVVRRALDDYFTAVFNEQERPRPPG